MNEPTPEQKLFEALQAWLKENGAALVVKVRTPTGDALIGIENFVPEQWAAIVVPIPTDKK